MSLFTLLRSRIKSAPAPQTKRRPATRFRPRLEALEDRALLSTLSVLNANDSGPNSLRAEIAAAHSGDTIAFAPALNGQTITLTSGELLINKNLTISGPGADELTISGNNHSRIFEVSKGAQVSVSGLTIAKGFAANGGGVLNNGTLTISDSTLSGNSATATAKGATHAGGAIDNFGTLSVNGCTLSANSAFPGGGIDNNSNGTVTVSASSFSGNSASIGGGVLNRGTLSVNNSLFLNNTAASYGGGIDSYGTATVIASTFTGNSSSSTVGGAIANTYGSSLTVRTSTLTGNHAYNNGGGIFSGGNPYATLVVSDCTLSGNSAYCGGGIDTWNVYGKATITNCTLTGNSASNSGGGIYDGSSVMTVSGSRLYGNSAMYGGGITNQTGALTLSDCQIGSSADPTLANIASVAGGGVYISAFATYGPTTVTLKDGSGVIGNTAPTGKGADIDNFSVIYVDRSSTIGSLDGNPAQLI